MEEIKTRERLEHLLKKHDRVLLDIFTSSCVPCKKLCPKLEELSREEKYLHSGTSPQRTYFCKINALLHPFITEPNDVVKEPVDSVPTLILFNKEEEKNRIQGSDMVEIKKFLS